MDLLIGAGKTRYLNTRPHARTHRKVFVRGFSAGSYSGICLLHLLWKFPRLDARGKLRGIACPPELLATIPIDKGPGLHLFHYDRDILCCWQPTWDSLQSLSCVCTLVTNEWSDLNDRFGKSEHAYGHWINLNIQVGYFQLWQDVTPLRLMSWLSYQLSPRTHLLNKECMSEFARIEPVQSDKIFQIGRFHLAGQLGMTLDMQ